MFLRILVSLCILSFSINGFAAGNVQIDGKKIKNREDMQRLLEKQLHFPTNYDKVPDAVYEVLLADLKTESIVRIKHLEILRKKLGEQYVDDFIEAVDFAAEENIHVVLILE